ncbi:MAG: 50S ribosomal protein L31 [Anaerolineae bacterium]|nr:50S ribosomal protein L31 [Anaerolineae bacterium]
MKESIHPKWYPEATVTCACGATWTTGATVPEIRTDVCSNCHPFYTGEMRIVDTEGQVDRFMKRLQARDSIRAEAEARASALTAPETPLSELELDKRIIDVLAEAGIDTAGALVEKLAEGDEALLAIPRFGHKSLIDAKKALRLRGFELPSAELA